MEPLSILKLAIGGATPQMFADLAMAGIAAVDFSVPTLADWMSGIVVIDGERRSPEWLSKHASAAKDVRLYGGVGLTEIPKLPKAQVVVLKGCWRVEKLPLTLPAAIYFQIEGRSRAVSLPELPKATHVSISRCGCLSSLPDFPKATHVNITNCPSLILSSNRASSRGNQFVMAKIRGHWRIVVGVKYFTIAEARLRWGKGTNPENPKGQQEPLALAEELHDKFAELYPDEVDQTTIFDPFFEYHAEKDIWKVVVGLGYQRYADLGALIHGEKNLDEVRAEMATAR